MGKGRGEEGPRASLVDRICWGRRSPFWKGGGGGGISRLEGKHDDFHYLWPCFIGQRTGGGAGGPQKGADADAAQCFFPILIISDNQAKYIT